MTLWYAYKYVCSSCRSVLVKWSRACANYIRGYGRSREIQVDGAHVYLRKFLKLGFATNEVLGTIEARTVQSCVMM